MSRTQQSLQSYLLLGHFEVGRCYCIFWIRRLFNVFPAYTYGTPIKDTQSFPNSKEGGDAHNTLRGATQRRESNPQKIVLEGKIVNHIKPR